jgi:hypothetical protein
VLIKACLNGGRSAEEHPALPLFPGELARDARSVVAAGAGALHLHPRRSDGSETLKAGDVGAVMEAVHAACPNIPVGVSRGAWIEPEVRRRVNLINTWGSLRREDRPDFASVNLSEQGAIEVCDALLESGVGVEAGLWSPEDASLLLQSDIARSCVRLLIELSRERTPQGSAGDGSKHRAPAGRSRHKDTAPLARRRSRRLADAYVRVGTRLRCAYGARRHVDAARQQTRPRQRSAGQCGAGSGRVGWTGGVVLQVTSYEPSPPRRRGIMQDRAYGFPRGPLPDSWVNRMVSM